MKILSFKDYDRKPIYLRNDTAKQYWSCGIAKYIKNNCVSFIY